ncbi:MAG: hypothetical protein ABW046_04140 [Actinoplanes sp.]
MISPQGQHQQHRNDFARRAGHEASTAPPSFGASPWWAAVAFMALVFTCVGAAGVVQSATMHCHGVSHRACLSLVFDDLTGKTKRPAPAD